MTDDPQLDERSLARHVLRRARGEAEPDVSRLVRALPSILAEAERRRRRLARPDALAAVAPLARRAIPRLAALAAALVLVAALAGTRGDAGGTGPAATGAATGGDAAQALRLDRLLLTGQAGTGTAPGVLDDLVATEDGDA